jgi:hypothetical protein
MVQLACYFVPAGSYGGYRSAGVRPCPADAPSTVRASAAGRTGPAHRPAPPGTGRGAGWPRPCRLDASGRTQQAGLGPARRPTAARRRPLDDSSPASPPGPGPARYTSPSATCRPQQPALLLQAPLPPVQRGSRPAERSLRGIFTRGTQVTAVAPGDETRGSTVLTADGGCYAADLVIGADGARGTRHGRPRAGW